jgi:hypothetical protein
MSRQELAASEAEITEREGFEPSIGFKPNTAFPVLLLRPLGHLSSAVLGDGRRASLIEAGGGFHRGGGFGFRAPWQSLEFEGSRNAEMLS